MDFKEETSVEHTSNQFADNIENEEFDEGHDNDNVCISIFNFRQLIFCLKNTLN